MTAEHDRLDASAAPGADWKTWGPYLAERAWGTVREDYSATGEAWEHVPHDHARSRAYRWNEDGLAGFCDRDQTVCLGLGLWNERDPILKERLFGVTGTQGNHGEDVKEYYYYLDSTPTHSYAKMLYKYPQVAYPYADLVHENERRSTGDSEYELVDAIGDALKAGRYFDVFVEYAKAGEEDILCRITAHNRGPDAAPLHLLPQVWFRNTWSWTHDAPRPQMEATDNREVRLRQEALGERWWYAEAPDGAAVDLLFAHNETNRERLFGAPTPSPYVKDGINNCVVEGTADAVHPEQRGTKAAAHIHTEVPAGAARTAEIRFTPERKQRPFVHCDRLIDDRRDEADAFYDAVQRDDLSDDETRIQRQAFAGLMWSKQFYHYDVDRWLEGDPAQPDPPEGRWRNRGWEHLNNKDVVSMPDAWEYPWYAAWDLAFHMIPVALIDAEWAKRQMVLLTREWYMHPSGQLPAYEWAFDDVNPPVHAWAAWRVYQIDRKQRGTGDTEFLEKVFHKMLLNFTWWVNQKDRDGQNIFQGGFLGLDNIGVFDRSQELPTGGHLEQADGTAWMGMFCLNMLAMALELAKTKPAYEDVATKFFEHFVYIAHSINDACGGTGLWDPEDGFYYDTVHCPSGEMIPLRTRSFVGLIPLFAVETLDKEQLAELPDFRRRMNWFIENRPDLMEHLTLDAGDDDKPRVLLSLVDEDRLRRVLARMLDPDQFLSDYGLRSLSKEHKDAPFTFNADGQQFSVQYEPAESRSGLFGGNSNWRGPVWFPVNYLMIESLQKFDHYYGDDLTVEMPEADEPQPLWDVAGHLSRRLTRLFRKDENGERPVFGDEELFQKAPHWQDELLFYEYFHGDNGAGLGASHQTGWTALVAKLLQQSGGSKDD
ncbi:MGH1-like glycoside hydrolase domain-containing protein [Salinibacter altiplanensis]|uniref:MGH1-like glycoside hydrolase domain-containing protein n=1 Tax=Salinibacter altiplanensis TaxID=1803181 RepID=UPI000C9EE25E|nr:glucosidase [Salinibacter altiplanensis]